MEEKVLYDYQVEGAEFLAQHRRAYLADDCGLGKTVEACYAAVLVEPRNVVVVAPASAIRNWEREWERWGDESIPFEVLSYDCLVRHGDAYYQGPDMPLNGLVILDEAHYAKSRTAQRTLAALTLARRAERAWLLSATPMPNHPGELWTTVKALWPHEVKVLGIRNYKEWLDEFTHWSNTIYGPKVWSAKNTHVLKPILDRFMLRRRLGDVALQLPPLRVHHHVLPDAGNYSERVLHDSGLDLAALRRQIEREEQSDFGSLSKLRRLLGTLKAPLVAEVIARELEERQYDKIVIMAHHLKTISLLGEELSEFGVTGFTGANSHRERQRAIDDFTNGNRSRVFLAQQSAGGIAVNLQAAHEIVLVEPSWSPGDNFQAIRRIHRIGSSEPCRARLFSLANSLDEAIMDVVARKLRMQVQLGL